MTPSLDYIINYREDGDVVSIANGRVMPIEDIGNSPMNFWFGKDWVQAIFPNVTRVPLLSCCR